MLSTFLTHLLASDFHTLLIVNTTQITFALNGLDEEVKMNSEIFLEKGLAGFKDLEGSTI